MDNACPQERMVWRVVIHKIVKCVDKNLRRLCGGCLLQT